MVGLRCVTNIKCCQATWSVETGHTELEDTCVGLTSNTTCNTFKSYELPRTNNDCWRRGVPSTSAYCHDLLLSIHSLRTRDCFIMWMSDFMALSRSFLLTGGIRSSGIEILLSQKIKQVNAAIYDAIRISYNFCINISIQTKFLIQKLDENLVTSIFYESKEHLVGFSSVRFWHGKMHQCVPVYSRVQCTLYNRSRSQTHT